MTHVVEELERRGWDALSGPDGAAFYDQLMTDDGLMVFPAMTLNKAATIRAITRERPWATFRLQDVRVVVDRDTALITYHAASRRQGQPEYRARMSSVYVRKDGEWRLLLHQQSPDPRSTS